MGRRGRVKQRVQSTRDNDRLRCLLLRLIRDDRPAFDALDRLVSRAVPRPCAKVYNS